MPTLKLFFQELPSIFKSDPFFFQSKPLTENRMHCIVVDDAVVRNTINRGRQCRRPFTVKLL